MSKVDFIKKKIFSSEAIMVDGEIKDFYEDDDGQLLIYSGECDHAPISLTDEMVKNSLETKNGFIYHDHQYGPHEVTFLVKDKVEWSYEQ